MAMYDYKCSKCEHRFEELRKLAERKETACPKCQSPAHQVITGVPMLDPRLGTDPAFASLSRKWERTQRRKATGQMRDSNNASYGGSEDVERDAYNLRKLYEK